MDNDIEMLNPRERREIGLAFAPEERLGHAAVGNLNLLENSLITDPKKRFQKKMGFIDFSELNEYTNKIIEKFNVKTTGASALASSLSGGNLQKFVVGREIGQKPSLFIVNQPTWGVDAAAAASIRQQILDLAKDGAAVIVISQDLDELLEISDVFCALVGGQLSSPENTSELNPSKLGMLISNSKEQV